MAQTVGQHTVAAFTSPLNGTSPIDANTVRGNDNTLRTGYNDHDADPGIHLQSSLLASRPSAGEAGRKWLTTDTGALKIFFDTGSTWAEISYLPISGGTVSGTLTVTGALTASGGVVGNVTGNVTGNASTATALQTARTINGVSFDGTANITVTADAGTLTGSTLASGVTASSLTSVGTLTSGAIGTGFTAIPNAALANSSVTINGTSVALGASGTVTAAAGTLTGTTLASGVTASSLTSVGTLTSLAVSGTTTLNTVAYTWPSADGTNGYVLSTNGSGTLAWVAQSGGGGGTTTNSLTAGSFLTGGSFNGSTAVTFAVDATDASTASKVVARDANGASSFDAVKLDGSTSGTVTVQGAATAGTWTLTLPTGAGSNGQVLTTNGSGATSWVAPSGVYTDSATTSSEASPYSVVSGDMGKRLVFSSNAATAPAFRLINANTDGIAVGSKFQVTTNTAQQVTVNSTDAASLNSTFNPNANGTVEAMAVQSDGKVIIGGSFTTVGGTTRNGIARINVDGTLDTGFNPNVGTSVQVYAVAIQSDGKIVIGGGFTTVGGTTRNRIARLNSDGTLDTGFNPDSNGVVLAVVVQNDGKILIGGSFTTIGGAAAANLARLNADGTRDTSFTAGTGGNGSVRRMALQPDGKIIFSGNASNYIARAGINGGIDASFSCALNNEVFGLLILPNGQIYIGGTFTTVNTITRTGFARINANGSLDTSFDPVMSAAAAIYAMARQDSRLIVISGQFTTLNSVAKTNLIRIFDDGRVFDSGPASPSTQAWAIAPAPNNRLYIGGAFTTVGGTTRNRVAALDIQDLVYTPNANPYPNVTQYDTATLEKLANGQWLMNKTA